MAFKWLPFMFSCLLMRSVSGIDMVDDLYYQKDEINKLTFSLDHRVRDKSKKENVGYTNGENAYAYMSKGISAVLSLTSENEMKNFLSLNEELKYCNFLPSHNDITKDKNVKNHKCYKKTFCGIIPNTEIIMNTVGGSAVGGNAVGGNTDRGNTVGGNTDRGNINKRQNQNTLYCVYVNKYHIILYHISEPTIVKANHIYQELFYEKEKKGIINCHSMNINIRSINIHTKNSCINNYILNHIKELCDDKKYCEIDFDIIKRNEKCELDEFFLVSINYECEDICNKKENEICDLHKGDGKIPTCAYGYNMLPRVKDICEKNYTCNEKICSLNEYCDRETESCKCKNSLIQPFNRETCQYEDICKVLNCPENSTCEKIDNGKKAECKCSRDKYFYNNKCFNIHELTFEIKMEVTKKEKLYLSNLYEGSSITHEHIYLECDHNHTIEVVNAYLSCYHISFEKNKMKYITDYLKKACNGKRKCAYGNNTDHMQNADMTTLCEKGNVIFHYEYLCAKGKEEQSTMTHKGNSSLQLFRRGYYTPSPIQGEAFVQEGIKIKEAHTNTSSTYVTSHLGEKKSAVFRSRFDSRIHCPGGKITVLKALLKTGDGCDDLDMTTSVKSYCDTLSDCDIGASHHFDTYCVNDQYLYVSYECTSLCNNCPDNSSCYGNRFNSRCICNNPYISKNYQNLFCEKPKDCKSVVCGKNQVCKNVGEEITCECANGFKNVEGVCVNDDPCDLLCPSNKSCIIENGNKKCKCTNGFTLENGVCICSEDNIMGEGNICIPKNKCKRKEYENICTNSKEQCIYDEKTDVIRCECLDHYVRTERGDCKAIDYCANISCGENEECKVVNYKGTCECKQNLKRNSNGVCIYNNLCLINKGGCPPDSQCIYSEKKPHQCICHKNGLVAVNGKCVIQDRCNEQNKCSDNSICVNRINKDPICICTFNYYKKNGVCVLQNPCLKDNGKCSRNSNCEFKNNKITCTCKVNYKAQNNMCVPKTTENDKSFSFQYNKEASIVLGSCGIIEFTYKNNQVIWKINRSNESYIFNYNYPTTGLIVIQIKNLHNSSVLYLKKKEENDVIFDDFQLDHSNCKYDNVFIYTHKDDVPRE
ncbi:Rh5 interacting protein, putative [Plasmodium ovale]|uniref:Rh5 interacting protein, putative n=1 Tax=Plasmodium ovale TaxID=36330 RepID=A0A1C3KRN7_PLAOA|nr:Rh5 interacting protein, putative [Plasmodium ovale]